MTPTHGTDHEERLDGILAEGPSPRAAFERSGLAGCPDCAAIVEDVLVLEEQVSRVGEGERRDVAEALAAEPRPSQPAVGRGAAGGTAARGSGRLLRIAAAAVAAGLAIWILAPHFTAESTDPLDVPDVTLGPGGDGSAGAPRLTPAGDVEAFGAFAWTAALPEGGSFRVRIEAEDGSVLATSPRLTETRWSPDAERARALPEVIRWTLEVYDAGGRLVSSHAERARRSSR